MKTYSLPPDVLARAWKNVWGASKLGLDSLAKTVIVEPMEHGVWLVGYGPTVVLASWCPSDPGMIELVPDLDADPVDDMLVVADADDRVGKLLGYLMRRWGKSNSAVPGFDDYVQFGPGVRQGTPGLFDGPDGGSAVRFTIPSEHVDANVVNINPPDWRSTLRTMGEGDRGAISPCAETLAALAGVTGCEPPEIAFGAGTLAKVTFRPSAGANPPVLGYIAVGKRQGADVPSGAGLVRQTFDRDGGWADGDEFVGAET